ncbi:MAG: 7-carboxy-7-deazaguanine synthase QueE [Candidatus Hodarchaeota archaeon]
MRGEKGFLYEIFSSFQGEGSALKGSCYGKRQIFIRFAGCNIALGDFGSQHCGCVWCDSPNSKKKEVEEVNVQSMPGTIDFQIYSNPSSTKFVLEHVKRLESPDLHSISFTGGEPLFQDDYCKSLAELLVKQGYVLYLETNGSLPEVVRKVVHLFDYCSCDVKDRSSGAADEKNWELLVNKEVETMKIFKDAGKEVFAKVVVTQNTTEEDVSWIAKKLKEIKVPLCLQIVTPYGPIKKAPNIQHVFKLTEKAAEYLSPENIAISTQMHKALGIL